MIILFTSRNHLSTDLFPFQTLQSWNPWWSCVTWLPLQAPDGNIIWSLEQLFSHCNLYTDCPHWDNPTRHQTHLLARFSGITRKTIFTLKHNKNISLIFNFLYAYFHRHCTKCLKWFCMMFAKELTPVVIAKLTVQVECGYFLQYYLNSVLIQSA